MHAHMIYICFPRNIFPAELDVTGQDVEIIVDQANRIGHAPRGSFSSVVYALLMAGF